MHGDVESQKHFAIISSPCIVPSVFSWGTQMESIYNKIKWKLCIKDHMIHALHSRVRATLIKSLY